jgi:hypothetical protein
LDSVQKDGKSSLELNIKNPNTGDPKMAKEDVKTEYQTVQSDIANLLGFFECQLGKQPKDLHWGHVGNLRHVRDALIEILSFISGFEIDEIENTLLETRL